MRKKLLSNGLSREQNVAKMIADYSQGGKAWDVPNCEKFLDIPYGTESKRQCIDIYKPLGEGPFPCLVEIHGGGWWTGDRKDSGMTDVLWALDHGYAVVSMGYRLTDEGVWPDQWNDVTAALEKLLEVGPGLGLDTARMCATGGSAGTTLSLLLALKSKKYKCAIMLAPILDFAAIRSQFEEVGIARSKMFGYPDEDTSMEAMLMGGSVEQVPGICAELTPINFVDEKCLPIFLYHGMLDKATPYLQTVEFARQAAEKTGDAERVQYKLLEATGHSGGEYKAQWLKDERLEFLKKYL